MPAAWRTLTTANDHGRLEADSVHVTFREGCPLSPAAVNDGAQLQTAFRSPYTLPMMMTMIAPAARMMRSQFPLLSADVQKTTFSDDRRQVKEQIR